jgi:amino acid transporter
MNIGLVFNKILGRPLASKDGKQQALSVMTGVPALGLDALASTAYGPEAALMILLSLGAVGFQYFLPIMIAVVLVLLLLYLSYMQTIMAYPEGGGAYIVASDNLGKRVGVWAAVALLLDYLLNVAVGISAGVGAIVSAIPSFQPYTLLLCLFVLLMLTLLNLRGVRESGLVFILPTLAFVACIGISLVMGLINIWQSHGHPQAVIAPPVFPSMSATVSMWLLLGAFANGLTAMTGVEAVSNAVPLFRKPTVKHAQWTLTLIVGILGLFLLCIGYLCPSYHIIAMDENQSGYQTILSQLVSAVMGKGVFYYFSMMSIFIILAYSAQTSFADFPRVCRLLAEDNFLPHFFAEKGRRLVFSHGIIVLAILSAMLIIVFKGITNNLIPLFAVGAFSAFLFSQSGMVMYWVRKKEPGTGIKLMCNLLGALATLIALIIIITEKFLQGAWIIVVVALLLMLLLTQINRHYKKISRAVEKPLELETEKLKPPIVIIPIQGWDRLSERALEFGLLLSDHIICVNISTESDDKEHWLRKIWVEKVKMPAKEANVAIPKLEIIKSPYRRINQPLLDFVKKVRKEHPKRLITIVVPELVEPHWYEYLLHNLHAARLRTSLFLERDNRTVVITIPWYLREQAH